ncbi:hypothetical protein KAR91_25980 [Candidatus Pacearchaeota archaeon]|nr:hypothetical protein [Candidatus Pacearchaeota archaeon]
MKLLDAMTKRGYGLADLVKATGKGERYCRMLMKYETRPGTKVAFKILDWLEPDTTLDELMLRPGK